MAADRLVTAETLGAWLLKCNADASDVASRPAGHRIDRWCVLPGYRSALMAAGQRVVFWVSGSRRRLPYGIWGVGRLAGAAAMGPAGDGPGTRLSVPLDLVLLGDAHRVRRDELRADPRFAGLEVLRQPQAGNPSFLTVAQAHALAGYVRWPS
ncbi:MAG TPA: hypothetical protein VES42_13660 [Pilimelia sp.]|nr:hypothetical protein [Pilimelia sp.]